MVIADRQDLVSPRKQKGTLRKVCRNVKNSMIAFFSFALHRVFLNLPSLPRAIKSGVINNEVISNYQVAIFVKEQILEKYYFPSIKMMRQNVDNTTIKSLITKSGYKFQAYEVEVSL